MAFEEEESRKYNSIKQQVKDSFDKLGGTERVGHKSSKSILANLTLGTQET